MILLDNIIFSLQKSGGISVVWYEHLKRLLSRTDLLFIEFNNVNHNIFRKQLNLTHHNVITYSDRILQLKRYLNPKITLLDQNVIFHSSYYRTLKGVENITTVHDFTYEYFVHGLRQKLHSWQKRQAILNSTKIICVSESTRDDLLRFIPQINSDNIVVIYNGVDDVFCKLPVQHYIGGIPYNPGEYLLYVGDRSAQYKQFALVVEVARQIKYPLVIVGKPIMNREIQQLSGVRYKVLTGIPSSLLNVLYNNAFCLLYPSLYEGFGIPVIEAQKAGCPVIAGANSSILEVIGKGGIALEQLDIPNIIDAIHTLDKGIYRNEIIKQGLENAQRFSWDKTYEQTINVYKTLM